MKLSRLALGVTLLSALACGDTGSTTTTGSDATDAADGTDSVDGTDATDAADGTDASDGTDGTDAADTPEGSDATDGVTPICTPGEAFCNGGTRVECNAQGTELVTTGCPGGCKDGACITATCTAGTTLCEGDVLVTCGADGTPQKSPCENGCEGEACKAPAQVCTPDAIVCDPALHKLMACAPDGLSAVPKEDCPHGCVEGAIECQAAQCDAGATRCSADNPKLVELCNDDQSGWEPLETLCTSSCKDGKCFVPSCEGGETHCGPLGIEVCNADGTAFEVQEFCKSGCTTTAEGPKCKLCKKGLTECDGAKVMTCADETAGFTVQTTCSDIQTCSGGACVDVVVVESAADYLALMKAMANCFMAQKLGACRPINTVGLPAAVTIDDLETWFCAQEDAGGFEASFASEAQYLAAADIIGGCTILDTNLQDLTFEQDEITPGKNGEQCIGYAKTTFSGEYVVVDLCSAL